MRSITEREKQNMWRGHTILLTFLKQIIWLKISVIHVMYSSSSHRIEKFACHAV